MQKTVKLTSRVSEVSIKSSKFKNYILTTDEHEAIGLVSHFANTVRKGLDKYPSGYFVDSEYLLSIINLKMVLLEELVYKIESDGLTLYMQTDDKKVDVTDAIIKTMTKADKKDEFTHEQAEAKLNALISITKSKKEEAAVLEEADESDKVSIEDLLFAGVDEKELKFFTQQEPKQHPDCECDCECDCATPDCACGCRDFEDLEDLEDVKKYEDLLVIASVLGLSQEEFEKVLEDYQELLDQELVEEQYSDGHEEFEALKDML